MGNLVEAPDIVMTDSNLNPSVMVAQLGARMHYAVPVMFHQAGMLDHFYTDLWFDDLPVIAQKGIQAIPHSGLQRFTSRSHADLPTEKVSAYTKEGLSYARRLAKTSSREQETRLYLEMGTKFTTWVADQIEKQQPTPDIGYLFNSAALELLEHPTARPSFCIVEQTLAPRAIERTILSQEYQKRGLSYPDDAYSTAYEKRERKEWELADVVVCGSNFVEQAVQELSGESVNTKVIPYGYSPDENYQPAEHHQVTQGDQFELLFVGNGGIRKGLPYLLEAVSGVQDIRLRIIGHTNLPGTIRSTYENHPNIEWLGRIPRHEMIDHYHSADAFVLPSLCEGSATVIYEAMSFGLPVICTPNSGSVITDGKEGFIVPIQSSEAIRDKIITLRDDSAMRKRMQEQALSTASEYTVDHYQQRLIEFVRQSVG
jgi:glycosyltransferase involved in cell wall biosynthesis